MSALNSVVLILAVRGAQKNMFQLLSLFPSEEAIKRGDKDSHPAVNIASQMHARVAHWQQGGW